MAQEEKAVYLSVLLKSWKVQNLWMDTKNHTKNESLTAWVLAQDFNVAIGRCFGNTETITKA